MLTPITFNEEAAALDGRNGFDFVFSTTHPAQEDQTHVSYHDDGARV